LREVPKAVKFCYHQGMGLLKNLGTALMIVILIAGFWFVYDNWSWIQSDFFQVYGNVPNFRLQDYLGRYHVLSEFAGYPLVINVWQADNPFAAEELRAFADIQLERGNKIVIIAINRGEPLSLAKGFTDKLGVTGNIIFLMDLSDSFYKALGGFQMPETLFINKEGRMVDRKHGPMKMPEIKQRIERIL